MSVYCSLHIWPLNAGTWQVWLAGEGTGDVGIAVHWQFLPSIHSAILIEQVTGLF